MGYKSDYQIEKELEKRAKKQEKAKKEENSNLPVKESGGIKKFFKKMKLSLGLGFSAIAGLIGLGSALQNEKSDYEENLDNNARVESESKDEINAVSQVEGKYAGSVKNIDIDSHTIVVEVEEPTSDIRKELEKQVITTPKRENIDADAIIENAKEEIGLSKDEYTPENSVNTTIENKGKEKDEILVEKTESESETKSQNNTEKLTDKEETTKTVINLDSEKNITNQEEKEGIDLVIEHDKEDKANIEDGTIIIEGDSNEEIVIGFEEEPTMEEEPSFVEPSNPFEDDWSR